MGSVNGQKHNPAILGKYAHINPNDVVFTPDWLAKMICGIVSIHALPASKAGFPFGFACAVYHLKRNYKGETKIEMLDIASAQTLF